MLRISFPILLGLMLSLCLVACPDSASDEVDWAVESRYQRANSALAKGELDIAEKEYRAVLTKKSKHPGALCKLARILLQRAEADTAGQADSLKEAGRLLNLAVKLEKDNIIAWQDLSRVRALQGDRAGAIGALDKMLAIKPDMVEALLQIVELEKADGNSESAERRLQAALAADPDGRVHLALARLMIQDKRLEDAAKQLKAIPMCPPKKSKAPCPTASYYEARDLLGGLAVRAGDLNKAREIYKDLVRVFPEDYMAWEILAALDEREEKWTEAEKKYRKSLEMDRVHLSGWRGLGRSLLAQGKPDEARYALRKADGLLRNSPTEGPDLAREVARLGDVSWARSVLDRSKVLLAGDPQSLARVEKAMAALGKEGAGEKEGAEEKPDGATPGGDKGEAGQ